MPRRMDDPVQQVRSFALRQQGWQPQREMVQEIEHRSRYAERDPPVIVFETLGPFHRANTGAGVPGTLHVGIPLGTDTWQSVTLVGRGLLMPAAGRIVSGRLIANEARTAGTMRLRIGIDEGGSVTETDWFDCALDATNPQTTAHIVPWDAGIPFAAGSKLFPRVVTSSTWAPTTIDVTAWLVVGYEATLS